MSRPVPATKSEDAFGSESADAVRLTRDLPLVVLIVALAGAIYLPTLLPGPGYSPDTMKFQYIGAVLGLSHPPGSPLYILINWLVAQVPLGVLAWRLNLLSAMAAAGGAVGLYLAARDLSGSRLAGITVAVVLLTTALFWEQSVVAEVYTSHAALLLASLWCLWRWHRHGRRRDLGAAAVLYGLSFGVHVMSIHFLLGWAAVVLGGHRSILVRPRELAIVAGGALTGLCTYLYYAIRPAFNPPISEYAISDLASFLDFIGGGSFRSRMFAADWEALTNEGVPWLVDLAVGNLGLPLIGLALVGLVVLLRRDLQFGVLAGAPLLTASAYAMTYQVGDPHVFWLPALYATLAAAAVGIVAVATAVATIAKRPRTRAALIALIAVLLAIERADVIAANRIRLDRSDDTVLASVGTRVLAEVEPGAVIFVRTDWSYHLLNYFLLGEHRRAGDDIEVVSVANDNCDAIRARIDERLDRRPVYAMGDTSECVTVDHYAIDAWDYSRRLPEYLAAIPPGRLVLAAVQGEATAAIAGPTWVDLYQLGVMRDMYGREGGSYAAALVRTALGFEGVHQAGDTPVEVIVGQGDVVAGRHLAPFDIRIRSGGALNDREAAIVADGIDYARPARGLQLVVFDAATGTPVERVTFDTHDTLSLREADFYRIHRRP